MARAARFVRTSSPHLVVQWGHNRQPIVADDADRRAWHNTLVSCLSGHAVRLHAWALCDDHFVLMVTPQEAPALGRFMQDLGRSYVAAFNRRHGRSGTLWDGRFQACVVQGGDHELDALRYVESASRVTADPAEAGPSVWAWSSCAHHLGQAADPSISDPPAYWALGNTPFEREAAYRVWLDQPLGATRVADIEACLRRGRPWGDAVFLQQLEQESGRTLSVRPRGRPRRPE